MRGTLRFRQGFEMVSRRNMALRFALPYVILKNQLALWASAQILLRL